MGESNPPGRSRILTTAFSGILALVLLVVGLRGTRVPGSTPFGANNVPSAAVSDDATTKRPVATLGPPRSEEAWIVHSVASAMLAFSPGSAGTQGLSIGHVEAGRYRIEASNGTLPPTEIDAAPFVWGPEAYLDLGRAALDGATPPSPDSEGLAPLRVLLTPSDENIHSLDEQLSRRLSAAPSDPKAHEASALVLGVLGLRFSEGRFTDLRDLINRMTAHLALAVAAQSGALGLEGRIARVVLDLLAHRERPAAAALLQVRSSPAPDVSAWDRALSMRATNDWRRLDKPEEATLLERLEYFRALEATRGKDVAAQGMGAATEEAIPDWTRLLVCGRTCLSVELGNALIGRAIGAELRSAAELGALLGAVGQDWWQKQQPDEPGRRVVPNELWRGLIERAVANALAGERSQMQQLGISGAIQAFGQQIPQMFPHSTLLVTLPNLLMNTGGPSGYKPDERAACETSASVITQTPWNMSAVQWAARFSACFNPRVPDPSLWFDTWLPRGTLYDFTNRLRALPGLKTNPIANPLLLSALTKYNGDLLTWTAGRIRKGEPDAGDFERFRNEFDYNVQLLRDWRTALSRSDRWKEALEPARIACKLEADACFELIELLVVDGATDEAFATGTQAFQSAGGTVRASHFESWMIEEYVRRGQLAAARAMAEAGAQTGSFNGLLAKARLVEREGRYAEAARILHQIDERYEDEMEAEFRLRRFARTSPEKRTEIQEALYKLGYDAPANIVTDEWMRGRGIPFRRDALALGLREGDAILEVNGWKISRVGQVRLVLGFSDATVVRLKVQHRKETGPGVNFPEEIQGPLTSVSYVPIRR